MQTASLARPRPTPTTHPTGRVAREINVDGFVDHPGYALVVGKVISAFRLAEQGHPATQCALFDDVIENDCHLRNLLDQRAQALAGKKVTIQSDGAEGESEIAANVLAEAIRALPLTEVIEHQATFNRYGWAVSEIEWDYRTINGRQWVVPVWIANVPARRFKIDPKSETLKLVTADFQVEGVALAPGKFIVTRRGGESRLARAALMRSATWPAMFKRFGTRDWVVFAEKFGLPLVLAKYEDGLSGNGRTDDNSQSVAQEIVNNIGNDGGAVVPSSVSVEIHEAGRNATSDVHKELIEYCNREMSKLVNGGTLSNDNSSSGGASYALGEVHASNTWNNVQYDAARIEESFRNQLCAPFVAFNSLNAKPPLILIQVTRDADPARRLEMATTMAANGVPFSIAQLRQETGIREPISDDDAGGLAAKPKEAVNK